MRFIYYLEGVPFGNKDIENKSRNEIYQNISKQIYNDQNIKDFDELLKLEKIKLRIEQQEMNDISNGISLNQLNKTH